MLKPSKLALDNLDKFNSTGHLDFGKASIKLKNNFIEVILNNPKYLNAEDEFTLYPLEAAIDIALLSNKSKICVLRGLKLIILNINKKEFLVQELISLTFMRENIFYVVFNQRNGSSTQNLQRYICKK